MAGAARDLAKDVHEAYEIQTHADHTSRNSWPAPRRIVVELARSRLPVLLDVGLPGILDLLHCSKKGRRGDPCRTSISVEEKRQHR